MRRLAASLIVLLAAGCCAPAEPVLVECPPELCIVNGEPLDG